MLALLWLKLAAAAPAAISCWFRAAEEEEAEVECRCSPASLEGETFLDPVRDFDFEETPDEDPESRGFISLPLFPWRMKFLSCSSKAILRKRTEELDCRWLMGRDEFEG